MKKGRPRESVVRVSGRDRRGRGSRAAASPSADEEAGAKDKAPTSWHLGRASRTVRRLRLWRPSQTPNRDRDTWRIPSQQSAPSKGAVVAAGLDRKKGRRDVVLRLRCAATLSAKGALKRTQLRGPVSGSQCPLGLARGVGSLKSKCGRSDIVPIGPSPSRQPG